MQRKRHINFKNLISSPSGYKNNKLHSITILSSLSSQDDNNSMKNKSNVLYSIPCVKACAYFCGKKYNSDNSSVMTVSGSDNHSTSNSHSTHGVWWRSQNRISRSARAVILTRASQVVMTPLSRISSWSKTAAFAFLVVGISLLSILGSIVLSNGSCYAADATIGDSTASMTLDTSDVLVNVSAGQTGYASKSVVVSTNNTESYALTITAPATLKNSSTNSTNPWSYAYGQSGSIEDMSYTTFDGSTKQLEAGVESDGKAKVLAFSSTFAEGLSSGHYKAEVTLALTATPKATTTAKWLWSTDGSEVGVDSGITTMQEMIPEVCNQVSTPTAVGTAGGTKAPTLKLKDSRDENEYTIAKLPDGKCWMVENLRLVNKPITSTDSNVSSNYTVPPSDISKFDTASTTQAAYYYPDTNTGYYSWCAATADTCSSATSNGTNASSSICPKGWKLPTGGTGTGTDFWKLFRNMGLTISNDNLASTSNGSTNWGTGDLIIAQDSPYNFTYTGYAIPGSFPSETTTHGYWWSRTADSGNQVYILHIANNYVSPGTTNYYRNLGLAVRCVAAEPKTFTLTYNKGPAGDATNMPSSQSCTTTSDSCTITLSDERPRWLGYYIVGWDTTQKTPNCGNIAQYKVGDEIILTRDLVLYATWCPSGCGIA